MTDQEARPQHHFSHRDTKPTIWLTDRELGQRWRCSVMKLHRLRQRGLLKRPFRTGDTGPNLNHIDDILKIEGGGANAERHGH